MKCIACQKDKPSQLDRYHNAQHISCCGYLQFENDKVIFNSLFNNRMTQFIINVRNPNVINIDCEPKKIIWEYGFDFKNKDKQIMQIERMMVFL